MHIRKRLAAVLAGAAACAVASVASAQETDFITYGVGIEQFEHRLALDDAADLIVWSGDAYVGNDEWKLRLVSEGEYAPDADAFEALEHQLVVTRLASDFFDLKAGVRYDRPAGPDRWYAVFGAHGLSPQWFEIDADLFLSEKGDVSGRLDVDYELLLTNRLILMPTLELNVAASDDTAIGVGAGFVSVETGLRLSYDIVDRAVAPYVGLNYERNLGRTARLARDEGEQIDAVSLTVGLRMTF